MCVCERERERESFYMRCHFIVSKSPITIRHDTKSQLYGSYISPINGPAAGKSQGYTTDDIKFLCSKGAARINVSGGMAT